MRSRWESGNLAESATGEPAGTLAKFFCLHRSDDGRHITVAAAITNKPMHDAKEGMVDIDGGNRAFPTLSDPDTVTYTLVPEPDADNFDGKWKQASSNEYVSSPSLVRLLNAMKAGTPLRDSPKARCVGTPDSPSDSWWQSDNYATIAGAPQGTVAKLFCLSRKDSGNKLLVAPAITNKPGLDRHDKHPHLATREVD